MVTYASKSNVLEGMQKKSGYDLGNEPYTDIIRHPSNLYAYVVTSVSADTILATPGQAIEDINPSSLHLHKNLATSSLVSFV